MFDEIGLLKEVSYDSYLINILKAPKGRKDIVKIVHATTVVQT